MRADAILPGNTEILKITHGEIENLVATVFINFQLNSLSVIHQIQDSMIDLQVTQYLRLRLIK